MSGDKIIMISSDGHRQAFKNFEKACRALHDTATKIITEFKIECFKSSSNKLRDMVEELSYRINHTIDGDLTSYAPRFGTFNKFLHIPCVIAFGNPKPFKGYSIITICRKQFMCLKTFVNLRFER